jgi:preprotein translocase subunit SecE
MSTPMNREQKRLLQRQGALNEDGTAARTERRTAVNRAKPAEERTKPAQFVREVRAELRKVAWPTRKEVINYSIIVLIAIALLTAIIAGLDYVFGSAVLSLFDT